MAEKKAKGASKAATRSTSKRRVPQKGKATEQKGADAGSGITLQIPKGVLIGVGIVALAAVIGAAVWFVAIRDTGPSEEELQAEREAQAKAKATAAAAECQEQVGELLTALQDLDGRLGGVGVNYEEYGRRVGDISAAYNLIPFKQLGIECGTRVGIPAEAAMNSYITAGQDWNDCFDDITCDLDSIDPELQDDWAAATTRINQAVRGVTEIGTVP